MSGSIGEGMVDMGSNPTGDHRVVSIKRAAANLIDMIQQLEVAATHPDLVSGGSELKQRAATLIAQACDMAVQTAVMRDPTPERNERNERETSPTQDDEPQGAPV